MKVWSSALLISFVLFHMHLLYSAAPASTPQSDPTQSPKPDYARHWAPIYRGPRGGRVATAATPLLSPPPPPHPQADMYHSVALDPGITDSGSSGGSYTSATSIAPHECDTFFRALAAAARKGVDILEQVRHFKSLLKHSDLRKMLDGDGNNCLHHAFKHDSARCLKIIMEHIGEDYDLLKSLWEQSNNAGRTPHDFLTSNPDPAVIDSLTEIVRRLPFAWESVQHEDVKDAPVYDGLPIDDKKKDCCIM